MSKLLEFVEVSKEYKSKRGLPIAALKRVSFSLDSGEVFGFVGPNGAGKSTTIKILLDVIGDYSGRVGIFGKSAKKPESRQNLAYVPESPSLYERFTPLELLKMALRMYGIKGVDDNKLCYHWLERFSLDQYAHRQIKQLSKGNVQRVALAKAMVVQPKLLVLDEPLSGLDPVGRKDVVEILHEYKQAGGAIFFTSHVLHDVERIADRFGFINQGELLTIQSPQELMNEQAGVFLVRYRCALNLGGASVRAGEYEVEVHQAKLPDLLVALNDAHGQLLDAKPVLTLEKVFFKLLQ